MACLSEDALSTLRALREDCGEVVEALKECDHVLRLTEYLDSPSAKTAAVVVHPSCATMGDRWSDARGEARAALKRFEENDA